jgi:molybdopterin-biosynthesis enzyme MoeA-like protein
MSIGALVIGDEILSGKRQDRHLPQVIATLERRGLGLDYAQVLGDDRARLADVLRGTFARDDLLFAFGGIGATPDDHTRQAAAAALNLPLEPHPQAVRAIEERFGAAAYPHRVLMAEFPAGSRVIPNTFNGIPAFAIRRHQFLPGFPQIAWPMLDWVLDTWYPDLTRERPVERSLVVHDVGESQLLPLMDAITARFPRTKLFSLPSFLPHGGRRLELGLRGLAADVEPAFTALRDGVAAAGVQWEEA